VALYYYTDLPADQQHAVLEGHQGWVREVCTVNVESDVFLASASDDGTVRLWDPATGQQYAVMETGHTEIYGLCAVSIDGRDLLASAGYEGTVELWNPASGQQHRVLDGHHTWVNGLCAVTHEDLAEADAWLDMNPATPCTQALSVRRDLIAAR
jgi:WD40 repeat protein